MRKLIAGLAGAAMVASMAAPAFASTSTDVKGSSYENAVAQLEALGVVTGDAGTGNFRPTDTITRGEFAVIADRLAGLGAAAQYLGQVNTSFKDVKSDYWGSGWVNVAKNAGLVAGYEDGTFRPNADVTYAEVATIYLHLLGYNEAHLGGTWPTNDVIKAAALGLTSNVGFDANKPATRGDVAKMAQTLLSLDKQTWDNNSSSYDDSNKTLMAANLNGLAVKQYFVADTPAYGATTGQVVFRTVYSDGSLNSGTVTANIASAYVVGASNVDGLMGHYVNAVVDSNNNLLFVADTTPASQIESGLLSSGTTVSNAYIGTDTTAVSTESSYVYSYNGVAGSSTTSGFDTNTNMKVVKDSNGKAVYVAVTKYDLSNKLVTGTNVGASSSTVSLSGAGTQRVTSSTVFTRNGKAATLADIQTGDVVSVIFGTDANGQYVKQLDAYNTQVTGTVSSLWTSGSTTKATVNGQTFTLDSSVVASVTLGSAYTFTVGNNNTVYAVTAAPSATSAETTGVVVKDNYDQLIVNNNSAYYADQVTVFTTTGKTVTVNVNKGTSPTHAALYNVGDFIDLYQNADGTIDTTKAGSLITLPKTINPVVSGTVDTTNNRIVDGSNYIPVTKSSVIIDDTNSAAPTLTTFDKIGLDAKVVYATDANGALTYAVVTSNPGAVAAAPTVNGLYVGEYTTQTLDANNNTVKNYYIQLSVNGTTNNYAVTSTLYGQTFVTNNLVSLKDSDSNGVYDQNAVFGPASATGVDTTNNKFNLGGDATKVFLVDANTKVEIVTASTGAVTYGNIFDINNLGGSGNVSVAATQYAVNGTTTAYHADTVVVTK